MPRGKGEKCQTSHSSAVGTRNSSGEQHSPPSIPSPAPPGPALLGSGLRALCSAGPGLLQGGFPLSKHFGNKSIPAAALPHSLGACEQREEPLCCAVFTSWPWLSRVIPLPLDVAGTLWSWDRDPALRGAAPPWSRASFLQKSLENAQWEEKCGEPGAARDSRGGSSRCQRSKLPGSSPVPPELCPRRASRRLHCLRFAHPCSVPFPVFPAHARLDCSLIDSSG